MIVYTAIFGASDSLKRPPAGAQCVCFTDSADLGGQGWEIVKWAREPHARRTARLLKMTPDALFPEAADSIWVDGSIEIRDLPALLADIGDAEIACFPHHDRASCYAEAKDVVRLRIAGRGKLLAATERYRREGFAPERLSTTGLFYRRHTPNVRAFNRLWREHLVEYGTNDQVHVDYCAWRCGVPITYLRGSYLDNPYAHYDQADHHHRRRPRFRLEKDCA